MWEIKQKVDTGFDGKRIDRHKLEQIGKSLEVADAKYGWWLKQAFIAKRIAASAGALLSIPVFYFMLPHPEWTLGIALAVPFILWQLFKLRRDLSRPQTISAILTEEGDYQMSVVTSLLRSIPNKKPGDR